MILPLITSPYIARVLGADGVGEYSYTYSIISMFTLIANFGLNNYGNRCVASVRDNQKKLNQVFSDLFFSHAGISFFVIIAYIGYIVNYGGEYKILLLIQGICLIGQLVDINWFFFGIEKFKLTVTRNAIIKILTVIAVFLFVKTEKDVWIYVLIMALGSALSESAVWLFVKRYVHLVKPDVHNLRKHISQMLIFLIPSIAVNIYKVMDKVMLGAMSGTVQLGFYENSEKIITTCLGFVTALGTVMLPRAANLVATGKKQESQKLIEKSSHFILMLSYAMGFGIIGISDVFPTVFWGEEFEECGWLLVGLAITIPFTAIANVARTQYLIPTYKERAYVTAVCTGAFINVGLNVLFIPHLEAKGAVIGTIVAEIVVCMIQLFTTQKEIPIWSYIGKSLPYLMFGFIECISVYLVGRKVEVSLFCLFIQMVVGIVVFILLSIIYMVCYKDKLLLSLVDNLKKRGN